MWWPTWGADLVTDLEVDMVASMVVDKVADMVDLPPGPICPLVHHTFFNFHFVSLSESSQRVKTTLLWPTWGADLLTDLEVDMVANMGVDKVADMVANIVANRKKLPTWSWT